MCLFPSLGARNADIGALCDANYQEFIRSIKELFKIREEVKMLRHAIISLNEALQRAGKALVSKVLGASRLELDMIFYLFLNLFRRANW